MFQHSTAHPDHTVPTVTHGPTTTLVHTVQNGLVHTYQQHDACDILLLHHLFPQPPSPAHAHRHTTTLVHMVQNGLVLHHQRQDTCGALLHPQHTHTGHSLHLSMLCRMAWSTPIRGKMLVAPSSSIISSSSSSSFLEVLAPLSVDARLSGMSLESSSRAVGGRSSRLPRLVSARSLLASAASFFSRPP